MRKKIMAVFIAVLALLSVPASAAPTIDTDKECHLRVEYFDDVDADEPISGAQFTVSKIAEINANGGYDSIIPGMEITADTKPDEINVTDGKKIMTSLNGVAELTIEQGLYLVKETKAATGHEKSAAFLVSAPYTKDGTDWEYDVTVSPKGSKIPVKKTPTPTPKPSSKKEYSRSANGSNGVTSNGTAAGVTSAKQAKTGDDNNIYMIAAAAAVLYLAAVAVLRRSRKEKEHA